jgi:nitroreductase
MEFREVVKRRKMVRAFLDEPIAPDVLDRILAAGRRGPSAGYSQGFGFLVLDRPEDTERFWGSAAHVEEEDWAVYRSVRPAPVLIVPCAGKHVYLERYAESDKGWTDLDEAHWPVAYWTVDTAFASLLILLAAIDEGLGALFFGLDQPGLDGVREEFGLPPEWDPIGVIAIGHPAPIDPVESSARTRSARPVEEVVHRGRW